MIEWIRFAVSAALILWGLACMCVAAFGLYRFRYALDRLHAASVADTMGILSLFAGLMIASGVSYTTLKLLLVILILWVTSPVTSHLISRLEITIHEGDLRNHIEVRR